MEKRHNRKHHHWNNSNNHNQNKNNSHEPQEEPKNQAPKFKFVSHENPEAAHKREEAIKELKAREIICPKCGEAITEISSAIADKSTGKPMHFECVMSQIAESETVGQNEKICYIGQGRFGVLYFENPRDQRKFTIKKIIDWEQRDQKSEWRGEISSLFSQVE